MSRLGFLKKYAVEGRHYNMEHEVGKELEKFKARNQRTPDHMVSMDAVLRNGNHHQLHDLMDHMLQQDTRGNMIARGWITSIGTNKNLDDSHVSKVIDLVHSGLSGDPSTIIGYANSTRPNKITHHGLEKIFNLNPSENGSDVVDHPASTPELVSKVANTDVPSLIQHGRYRALNSPKIPVEDLIKHSTHPDEYMRASVAANHKLPMEHLVRLTNDESKMVRHQANNVLENRS